MLGQIIGGASRGQVRSFEAEQQDRGGAQHWQAREGRTRSNRVWCTTTITTTTTTTITTTTTTTNNRSCRVWWAVLCGSLKERQWQCLPLDSNF